MARVVRLGVDRATLARMLQSHGETGLAERATSLTDDQLARVQTLGAYYAFSDDALALGGSMGGTRALSLAALDVLEGSGRDLRRQHTEAEIAMGWSEEPDAEERMRDRQLRLRAMEKQQPEPR